MLDAMAPPLDPDRVVSATVAASAEVASVVAGFVRLPRKVLTMVEKADALLDRADSLMVQAERSLEHTEGLMPVLQQVDRLGPDVAELLRVTDEVRRAVLGIPGVGMLWRRGGPAAEATGTDQPAR